MKTDQNIWVVEAHDLGALQVRPVDDAIKLNRKRWLEGTGSDRLLVGIGGTIDEALEEERELKRMKGGNLKLETGNLEEPIPAKEGEKK